MFKNDIKLFSILFLIGGKRTLTEVRAFLFSLKLDLIEIRQNQLQVGLYNNTKNIKIILKL